MLDRSQRSRLVAAVLLGCSALLPTPSEAQDADVIACDETADCPLALECETTRTVESCPTEARAGSSGGRADAGGCTVQEEPVQSPGCVYAPAICTENAECGAGLTCQAIGRVEECSSGPGAEPTCTEVFTSYCFPIRQDCAEQGDCQDGFRCTMLPEGAQDHPPPGWEGATKLCLPEGIALFIEGRVELAKSSRLTSTESEALGNDRAADETGDDGSGGCSVASVRAMKPRSYGLLGLAFGFFLARRRHSGSRCAGSCR